MDNRIERLENWIESLSNELIKSTLLQCVDDLIDSGDIKFYDNSPAPYWDSDGEYVDGKEYDNE